MCILIRNSARIHGHNVLATDSYELRSIELIGRTAMDPTSGP